MTSFAAANAAITNGASTTLTAVFANGTGTIDNGVGAVISGTPVSISPTTDTTYTLTVVDAAGVSVTQQTIVTVGSLTVPSPSIASFSATPWVITNGGTTMLVAAFSGGSGVIDNGVGPVTTGTPATVSPPADTVYTLTVTNSAGVSVTGQLIVTVVPPPSITGITAATSPITNGESTTLTPSFENGAGSIDNGIGPTLSGIPIVVTPSSNTTYTLTVTNSAGTSISQQVTVAVVAPPTISSYTASQTSVTNGGSATLTPTFSNGTGTIDNAIGTVISGMPVQITPPSSATYTLTVTNSAGTSVTQQLAISVVPPPSITSFESTESTITRGDTTTLTAVFTDGVGSIDKGVGAVTSGTPVIVGPTIDTTYTLTVTNSAGTTVTQALVVAVLPGKFTPTTGDLTTGRAYHTSTLLADDKVLIVGGFDSQTFCFGTAEVYDPSTDTFSNVGDLVTTRCFYHSATLLGDGSVLIVGGNDENGAVDVAELYDPSTGAFSSTGSTAVARTGHTASLLESGKVLVVGGANTNVAEIYDPADGTFSDAGTMATTRKFHTATVLPDGKVLIAGGQVNTDPGPPGITSSAELYDPITDTSVPTGDLAIPRINHTATLLPDGRVLIVGGSDGTDDLQEAEIYDPTAGTFSSAGLTSVRRDFHTATLLPDGHVLIAGGYNQDDGSLASAELFDPLIDTFIATGSMATARYSHSATLLTTGQVLVVGGDPVLSSAELYADVPDPH